MQFMDVLRELPLNVKTVITFIVALPLSVITTLINLALLLLPTSSLHKNVKGKVVLITGGASGVGRAIAIGLAKKGAKIVSWDMNQKGNEETAVIIKQIGGNCISYTVDISNRAMVYSTADLVKKDIGFVDILINNAGISGNKSDFTHRQDKSFMKTMDVNFFSHVWTVNSFLPDMIDTKYGHIVSISSLAGVSAHQFIEYSTSKFAVCGFIESLRNRLDALGHSGITVSLICPSYIDTPLLTEEFCDYPKMTLEFATEKIIDGILRDKEFFIIPNSGKLVPLIKALLPTFVWMKSTNFIFWSNKMKNAY